MLRLFVSVFAHAQISVSHQGGCIKALAAHSNTVTALLRLLLTVTESVLQRNATKVTPSTVCILLSISVACCHACYKHTLHYPTLSLVCSVEGFSVCLTNDTAHLRLCMSKVLLTVIILCIVLFALFVLLQVLAVVTAILQDTTQQQQYNSSSSSSSCSKPSLLVLMLIAQVWCNSRQCTLVFTAVYST
jgi:hypothetical protein